MGDGIPLRRIAGIRVAASWTLLIVVALLVLGPAGGVLPRGYPGLAAGWYLAAVGRGAVPGVAAGPRARPRAGGPPRRRRRREHHLLAVRGVARLSGAPWTVAGSGTP